MKTKFPSRAEREDEVVVGAARVVRAEVRVRARVESFMVNGWVV